MAGSKQLHCGAAPANQTEGKLKSYRVEVQAYVSLGAHLSGIDYGEPDE
jgi:hypothetical protein